MVMMPSEKIQRVHALIDIAEETSARRFHWMLAMAQRHWEAGTSQMAADTLAFLLLQADLPTTLRDKAEALFAELESRICPRVILDARQFAIDMDAQSMIEYLFDYD